MTNYAEIVMEWEMSRIERELLKIEEEKNLPDDLCDWLLALKKEKEYRINMIG